MESESRTGSMRAWYAVVLLGMLYIVAFVDRVILALLIQPLRAEFAISDTQISLLIGFTFALFYALVGLPIGRMADRINRRRLILASTVIWAACTFGSGFATSFGMLCLLRIGVAVGEAALSPSAISMIGDLFPPSRRAAATSVYMALGALGATGGYILGGLMVGAIGQIDSVSVPLIGAVKPWQFTFILVSLPAVILGLIFLFTVREPARPPVAPEAPPSRALAWAAPLWRPLIILFLAGSVGQTMVHGAATWAPTLLVRDYGWTIGAAGVRVGLVTMVCGVGGMMLWPIFAERWARSGRADALPLTLAIGVGGGALLVAACAFAPGVVMFQIFYGGAMFMLMGTGVLLMVAIQAFAPSSMRGELMALCLLLTGLIALGVGPTLVPLAGQWIGAADGELKPGYVAIALIAGPLATVLALWCRRGLVGLARAGDPL